MEMPFTLRTLPPEALEVLRYFGKAGGAAAHADDIAEGSGLGPKSFGKALRRLVTKNYLVMEREQVYRLSDAGKRLTAELLEYDLIAPPQAGQKVVPPRFVRRRVVLAAPQQVIAGQPTMVFVGIDDAETEELVPEAIDVLLRLSLVNGEPREPRELSLRLANRHVQQALEITPGYYTQIRIRLQVCQVEDDAIDEEACGGLYVDLPVAVSGPPASLAAYGADIMLKDTSGIDISDFLSM
ncbi:MAG: hypothetical protein ACUVS2_07925 [Candidatus Flexifilum sp.]|jgi:DNA-binding MarR family transcriptional regulator